MSSWYNDRLRARAGALAQAAEPFLTEQAFARGPDGVIALCERMEHWVTRDDVDEEAERRFVEQAGALLGLLLIDHVGDAGHVARDGAHRVRLGRYGFFDPFAAVDRALDASDVRRALARQIAIAEAESKAEGPISRVVNTFLSALSEVRPDLALVEQFEYSLWLKPSAGESFEVDLRKAIESTREQSPDAVDAVVRKLLAVLPGAPTQHESFAEVGDRLMPRIARADALLPGLFGATLNDELVIALIVEHEGRARYVKQGEFEAWDREDVLSISLENLRARSQAARILDDNGIWIARTGDGRDSARILLPSLHAELRARIGEHIMIGLPHRDTFFACDARERSLVEQLEARVAHDAARAPHKLCARVLPLRELADYLVGTQPNCKR